MAGAHSASQIEALVRDVERARDQCGPGGLAVLLNEGASISEKEALAGITGVTVLCAEQSAGWLQQDGRQATSPMVLVRDGVNRLSMSQLLRLYGGGARYLLEREGLRWRRRSLARCISYRMARAVAVRAVVRLDRLDSRIQAHATGPVGRAASRTLERVRRLVVEARHSRHGRDLTSTDLSGPTLLSPSDFEPGRVLMINSALAWGGAERQLVNTMVGLRQRGWDVRLACENLGRVPDSRFFAPELDRHGLRYDTLDDIGRAQAVRLLESGLGLRVEERLGRLPAPFDNALWPYVLAMLDVRPSVVHAWQDQTSVLAGVAAAVVGVPRVVLSTRNMAPFRFAYHEPHMRAAYRALSGAERVRLLNNSRAGAADYAQWLGIPEQTFDIVHNGFDFDALEAEDDAGWRLGLPMPSGTPIIGSIFRFYAEKDPGLWMETAARVAEQRPDCHFLVLGIGPLREHALDLAKRSGIADRVHLPGALQQPHAVLRRMSVFLLTSRLEGLPNVLIEAQAHGVPVVATAAGGSAEAFSHGETGWLVEERSPAAIAARIVSTLEDRAWMEKCRVLAPRLARQRFGINRMLDETIALYAPAPSPESAVTPQR